MNLKSIIKNFSINFKTVNCPKCKEPQPKIRKPQGMNEILWGGWTCKLCGCKMNKYGKERD